MRCDYIKPNKKQCGAYALHNSKLCFTHNPLTKQHHRQVAVEGGKMTYNKGLVTLEPIELTDPESILYLLSDTINRVRRAREDGGLDVRVANCIGFLASKMLEAREKITLEERIDKLEEVLAKKGYV